MAEAAPPPAVADGSTPAPPTSAAAAPEAAPAPVAQPAPPKAAGRAWGLLKKMGAYAANENLNLPTDNQRLRDVIADVSEAANKARNDLCRVAKVSSGSLGSVKDVFDEMMRDMTAKVTDLSKDQVAEERRKARDELQNQSAEQQARFERQMQDAGEEGTRAFAATAS